MNDSDSPARVRRRHRWWKRRQVWIGAVCIGIAVLLTLWLLSMMGHGPPAE